MNCPVPCEYNECCLYKDEWSLCPLFQRMAVGIVEVICVVVALWVVGRKGESNG